MGCLLHLSPKFYHHIFLFVTADLNIDWKESILRASRGVALSCGIKAIEILNLWKFVFFSLNISFLESKSEEKALASGTGPRPTSAGGQRPASGGLTPEETEAMMIQLDDVDEQVREDRIFKKS